MIIAPRRREGDGRRDPRRERGAVLMEAFVVAPLLIFLLLAIVEAGNLLYANLSVDQMTGAGVRTAGLTLNASDADYKILQRIRREAGASKTNNIELVVVYKAASRGSSPTTACAAGTASADCSVYRKTDFSKTAGQLTCGYCPSTRVSGDLIGVWVKYRQPSVSGIMSPRMLTSQGVVSLEMPT